MNDTFLEAVNFFKKLEIIEKDITSDVDKSDGNLNLEVTYIFDGKSYTTKPLSYSLTSNQDNVQNIESIKKIFGKDVYWLDIETHDWPKPSGETDIDNLIISDMTDDAEFRGLLLKIANNNKNGFMQILTNDGKSPQYSINMENNNHWHDLIKLFKEIIDNGKYPEKSFFERLIFQWQNKNNKKVRTTLHKDFGNRSYIEVLIKNLNNLQLKKK